MTDLQAIAVRALADHHHHHHHHGSSEREIKQQSEPPTRDEAARRIQECFKRKKFLTYVAKWVEMSKLRRQRIQEVAETEKDYVRHLEEIVNVFLRPLKDQQILTEQQLHTVFGDIEIILNSHKVLADTLTERLNSFNARSGVADIFIIWLDNRPLLDAYVDFIKNYDRVLAAVKVYMEENKKFDAFVQQQQSATMGRGTFFLTSLLICVVQRFPRYVLFFRDLKKYNADNSDDFRLAEPLLACTDEITHALNTGATEHAALVHNFVMHTFNRPTWCEVCDGFLTGLRRKGVKCKACGMTAHTQCQFHVNTPCGKEVIFNQGLLPHMSKKAQRRRNTGHHHESSNEREDSSIGARKDV
eukprot:TRINITY_DN5845_c0_g1_i1.p2 TRINITY_DN5845_c0_g1~~TRINITY_DN5845_c0_g1_i1.p2  ORF type:complete len:378 (+),score=118.98 TRINITY_DN5845_c0_g1_i1:61-1134(+)